METDLDKLLSKLEKARFTGELHLRFESGEIAGAVLEHHLPFSELKRELPTLEEEFQLKP
jgi:hypothetical protein